MSDRRMLIKSARVVDVLQKYVALTFDRQSVRFVYIVIGWLLCLKLMFTEVC